MAKKTKKQLIEEWMKRQDICGDNPWWDKGTTYYNITADQIIRIAAHLHKHQ